MLQIEWNDSQGYTHYGIVNDVTFQPATLLVQPLTDTYFAKSGIELNTTTTEILKLGEEQEEREDIIVDTEGEIYRQSPVKHQILKPQNR